MESFKNHFLNFVLLVFIQVSLSFSSIGVSQQLADLAILETLSENVSKRQSNQPNLPNDEVIEESSEDSRPKVLIDYSDSGYSYIGDTEFNSTQQEKLDKEPLTYFGYDYFTNVPQTYAQVQNVPIPPAYLIGPGDNVKVILFGKESSEFTLEVSRSGEILFPEIGPIYVAGLSFKEMQETISGIVANRIIGTEVSVTLGSLRNINIFVLGEAFRPGMYTVSALSTLTNAIFLSGGPKENGSLRNIQLKRNGEIVSRFDLYELLLNGDTTKDSRLASGDVVFIPTVNKTVGINGEIFKPGIYELKENEDIQDLIKFAGSMKPKANPQDLEILRIDQDNEGFRLFETNLADNNLSLLNGDVVKIKSIMNNINNAILIKGHFQKPGFYPLSESLRIGDLITADNILAMTDLSYVLVKRESKEDANFKFLQVDLNKIFANNDSEENILLEERDEIIIFPSLIRSDDIVTKIIEGQDQIEMNMDVNSSVSPDFTRSPSAMRRSILAANLDSEKDNDQPVASNSDEIIQQNSERYYEYQIYNYCVIPKSVITDLIEFDGFSTKKTFNIDELKEIDSEEKFNQFIIQVDREAAKEEVISEARINNKINLTKICRDQLITPILNIAIRQSANNTNSLISVYGNIHFPGQYPLTEGMNLRDAISASGGYRDNSYLSEVELSRAKISNKSIRYSNKAYSMENNSSSEIISLQGNDVVNVKSMGSEIKTVTIDGEVNFPGTYPVSDNESLIELIERAGGLKTSAYIKGARFVRKSLQIEEQNRLVKAQSELERKIALSTQNAGLGVQQTNLDSLQALTGLLTDEIDPDSLGRLIINLESMIEGKRDLILEDGDSLFIPKERQSILVIGEVFVPNSHVFDDEKSVADYIDLSGGTNEYADIDNIYTIKADGRILSSSEMASSGFFRANRTSLEPGDTVVVPLKLQPFDTIKATTEISQIVYQMALAAAAVNSF